MSVKLYKPITIVAVSGVIALSLLLFVSLFGTYVMWTTNILEDKLNDVSLLVYHKKISHFKIQLH